MDTQLKIVNMLELPIKTPAGIAWAGHEFWCNDYSTGQLCRIDIFTGDITKSLQCPGVVSGLAWDGKHLWQTRMDEDWIQRINPQSLDFDLTLSVEKGDGNRLSDIAWDGQHFWAVSQKSAHILAINLEDGSEFQSFRSPVASTGLTYHDGSLWVSFAHEMEYDAKRDSFNWISDTKQFFMGQIDHTDGRILAQYSLDFLPTGLAWNEGQLWLSNSINGALYIGELL